MRVRSVRVLVVALVAALVATLAGLPGVVSPAAAAAKVTKSAASPRAAASGHLSPGTVSPAAPGTPSGPAKTTEVVGLRNRTSNTFDVPGIGYKTVISGGPVNYQDTKGAWQPIDTTLIADTAPGFAWQNKAADYRVEFPADLSDGPVRVAEGAQWVSFALVGAKAVGKVNGASITYPDALPGVTVTYTVTTSGVQESLTLASAAATGTFGFSVKTSTGLAPQLVGGATGEVGILDGKGQSVFTLPAAFAEDAKDRITGHAAVSSALANPQAAALGTGAGATLTETLAPAWLTAAARSFPLTVDPTVSIAPSTDCYLLDGTYAGISYCNSIVVELGYGVAGTTNNHRHGLYQFSTSAIPSGSVVLSADLQLQVVGASSGSVSFPLQAVSVTQPWTSAATWTKRDSTNNWTTGGGTYDASNVYDTRTITGTLGAFHIYPTKLVGDWVSGVTTNDGLLLKPQNESSVTGTVQVGSNENGTPANRPTMSVVWQAQLGRRSVNTIVDQQLDDRCTAGVNAGNGNLNLRCLEGSLPGVGGTPLNFYRYYNSAASAGLLGNPATTPLGVNRWQLSTGVYIAYEGNALTYFDGSGVPWQFNSVNGASPPTAPPGLDATLATITNGYTITFKQTGIIYTFIAQAGTILSWQLTQIQDKNGNQTKIYYNSGGTLLKVVDTRGRVTTPTYTSGFLTQLTGDQLDGGGSPICCAAYSYTGNNLTSSGDSTGKITTYGYTDIAGGPTQELTSFVDPLGHSTEFGYDTSGRVTSITRHPSAGVNYITGYAYNDAASPPNNVLTDPNGHATTYYYDNSLYAPRVTKVKDANNNSRQTSYSPDAQVASTTTPAGGMTTNTFVTGVNSGQTPTQTAGPMGATTKFGYQPTDAACPTGARAPTKTGSPYQQLCSSDPAGNQSTQAYDGTGGAFGNQKSTTDGSNAKSQVAYGAAGGQVSSSTDPDNNVTSYVYQPSSYGNGSAVLHTITPPSSGGSTLTTKTVTYDNNSRLQTLTNGNGATATYGYDDDNRLLSITYTGTPTATNVAYTYDDAGNLKTQTDASGSTTYNYDWMNRLTSKVLPGSVTLGYGYDPANNLSSLTQGGATTNYYYDPANQVTSMVDRNGTTTKFKYDMDGNRTDEWTNANSNTPPTTWALHAKTSYDSADRITEVIDYRASSDTPANRVLDISYCRSTTTGTCPTTTGSTDRDKIQWSKDNLSGITTNYTYSTAGRLTAATPSSGTTYTYTYDAAGNRTSNKTGAGATVYATYNPANQLCWTGTTNGTCASPPGGSTTTYAFDHDGNQTASPTNTLGYNGTDQATLINGGAYTYAGSDQNERTQAGGSVGYRNGQLGVQSETFGAGTNYFERDPAGKPIALIQGGTEYYYAYDGQGNVRDLLDTSGTVQTGYTYDPYGDHGTVLGPNTTLGNSNHYRYDGEYFDTSTNLYKIGARYYDPITARWTQQDSINQVNDPNNGNLYSYVNGDPANEKDSAGTFGFSDFASTVVGGIAGAVAGTAVIAACAATGPVCLAAGAVAGAVGGAFGGGAAAVVAGGDQSQVESGALEGAASGATSALITPALGAVKDFFTP